MKVGYIVLIVFSIAIIIISIVAICLEAKRRRDVRKHMYSEMYDPDDPDYHTEISRNRNRSAFAIVRILGIIIGVPLLTWGIWGAAHALIYSPPPFPASPELITKAEFDEIENGMTYEQVARIIGSEGAVISEAGQKGEIGYFVMYEWAGYGSIGANANFMFSDGILDSKAQYGLK